MIQKGVTLTITPKMPTSKFSQTMNELYREYGEIIDIQKGRYQRREISFLQYQGLTYSAIDELINKYSPRIRGTDDKKAARHNLEHSWAFGDPVANDIISRKYNIPIRSPTDKLLIIGEFLAKELPKL